MGIHDCVIPAGMPPFRLRSKPKPKQIKVSFWAYKKRCSVILTAIPRLPSSCGSSRSTLPLIAAIEPDPFNSRTIKLICDRSLILHGIRRKRPEELRFSTRQSRLTISPSRSMPHTLAGIESLRRGLALRSRPLFRKVETSGLKNGRCPSRTSLALCSNTAAILGETSFNLNLG